jgi:hypothetical protein
MRIRCANSGDPLSYLLLPDGNKFSIFTPSNLDITQFRDVFPGPYSELLDIAAKFDNDSECFGWSNESYLNGWRNQYREIPKGRYVVTITVISFGEKISDRFRLENLASRENFRLLNINKDVKANIIKKLNLKSFFYIVTFPIFEIT